MNFKEWLLNEKFDSSSLYKSLKLLGFIINNNGIWQKTKYGAKLFVMGENDEDKPYQKYCPSEYWRIVLQIPAKKLDARTQQAISAFFYIRIKWEQNKDKKLSTYDDTYDKKTKQFYDKFIDPSNSPPAQQKKIREKIYPKPDDIYANDLNKEIQFVWYIYDATEGFRLLDGILEKPPVFTDDWDEGGDDFYSPQPVSPKNLTGVS